MFTCTFAYSTLYSTPWSIITIIFGDNITITNYWLDSITITLFIWLIVC